MTPVFIFIFIPVYDTHEINRERIYEKCKERKREREILFLVSTVINIQIAQYISIQNR